MLLYEITVLNTKTQERILVDEFDSIESLSRAYRLSLKNGSDGCLIGLPCDESSYIVYFTLVDDTAGTRQEISDPRVFEEDLDLM